MGPSTTPCQEGRQTGLANLNNIDLFTTLSLPRNVTYVWNRNSPFSALRPIFQVWAGGRGCVRAHARVCCVLCAVCVCAVCFVPCVCAVCVCARARCVCCVCGGGSVWNCDSPISVLRPISLVLCVRAPACVRVCLCVCLWCVVCGVVCGVVRLSTVRVRVVCVVCGVCVLCVVCGVCMLFVRFFCVCVGVCVCGVVWCTVHSGGDAIEWFLAGAPRTRQSSAVVK